MLRFPAAGPSVPATYVFPTERQCSVFRAISADKPPPSPQVNGNAPFFGAFYGVSGNFERICSVFQAVFKPFSDPKVNGINRYEWVGILRFRHFIVENLYFDYSFIFISALTKMFLRTMPLVPILLLLNDGT